MKKQNGFSLVELLVLITLLGIVMSVIALRSPPTSMFRLTATADTIVQSLRLTKILSMSENTRYRMVLSANSFQIQTADGTPYEQLEDNATTVNFEQGVTLSPATTVVFDSLGTPRDVSGNVLTQAVVLTLSAAGDTRTITVLPQTGFIND